MDWLLVMRRADPTMLVVESEKCVELEWEERFWWCVLLIFTIHRSIPSGARSTAE